MERLNFDMFWKKVFINHPNRDDDIEEAYKTYQMANEKAPFPDDWKRVPLIDLPFHVGDGDIIATHFITYRPNDPNDYVSKIYYRIYRPVLKNGRNGMLRMYACNEQGEPLYMSRPAKYKDEVEVIVDGKVKSYSTTLFEVRYCNKPSDFNIFYIKPRTTAPTNSRLRLLRIQAQAKIKLQQQRMR